MINNRQNGRRRGRGGGVPRPNGGGGGPDRGNRLDNRARGNASQLHEKYKALARDAQLQGDRVTTEYYLQFADHYFRLLNENRARMEEHQQRYRRDDYAAPADSGFDEDEAAPPARASDERETMERRPFVPEPHGAQQGHSQRETPVETAQASTNAGEEAAPNRPRRGRRPTQQANDIDSAEPRIEMDRLPPALTAAPAENEGGEEKPRRRGRPPRSPAVAVDV